ncbi:MAG TPA: MarR family transcriptional regulator [Hyphomicrobiales bacterium]|nr:MarR family transcriptional regulator [Hyphomicrobiales bacterium]
MSKPAPLPFALTHEVRDACLCLHVRRAARATTRRYDEALRPAGLTSGQFSLLMALNRPEPPTIGEVAALLAMDRTTLTADLKPLARDGFVAIAVDAKDRRGRRLALTETGRVALAAAVPLWRKAQADNAARTGGLDADALRAALVALA